MEPVCPQCHVPVRPTDFFCFNCGKNLRPAPLSLSFEKLFMYYLGAVALPPMGIVWGIKYLKEQNQTAKIHGALLIIVTVVSLILLIIWTVQFMNTIRNQVGDQFNQIPL